MDVAIHCNLLGKHLMFLSLRVDLENAVVLSLLQFVDLSRDDQSSPKDGFMPSSNHCSLRKHYIFLAVVR